MGSENNFALPLDLPSWNEGIKSLFAQPSAMLKDVAPAENSKPAHDTNMGSVRRVLATNQGASAQIYHQRVIHDPHALHAQGLANLPTAKDAEFWLRKAAGLAPKEAERVLMEALQRDVQPVASIARALHELHKALENSPAPAGLLLAIPSLAIDGPLSLGGAPGSLTPGRTGLSGKAFRVPSRLANTPGAARSHGAAAPQTKFHGILKKLQFSGAAPTVVAAEEPKPEEPSVPVAAPAVNASAPTTTTKRLQFESHTKHQSLETPLGAPFLATGAGIGATTTAAATNKLPGGYKTSMRKVTFGGNTVSPSHNPPHRRTFMMVGFQTPSAVAEGSSGDEDDNDEQGEAGGGNGTVNSRNAGATPFDRRLSALVAKYEDDTATVEEEGEKAQAGLSADAGATPTIDLWKRLSSISATESIKALSKSMENDCDNGGESSSLESMSLAGSTPVVLVDEGNAAAVDAVEKEKNKSGNDDVSPNTAVASILGVLLRNSLEDIEASKAAEAAAAPRSLPSRDAVSPTSGVLSMVPAARSSETLTANANTPARTLTPMSIDGVLRDEDGIPLATPSSVTFFRGGAHASRRNDDGLPADLFRSFTTPPESDDFAVRVEREVTEEEIVVSPDADFAFNFPGSVRHHQHQAAATPPASATNTAGANAATPGSASDTSSEGTPELKLKNASTAAKTGRHAPLSPFSHFTPTPSSARKALTPQTAASLGKAQRVRTPSPSPAPSAVDNNDNSNNNVALNEQAAFDVFPPPSLTREVRGLLQGMSLATPPPGPRAVSLSPARASPMQQRELGVKTVVTPVRRSPRVAAAVGAVDDATGGAKASNDVAEMLESAGFVYVPNPALVQTEKGKSSTTSPRAGKKEQVAATATVVTDENSEVTPGSRYSLRSASKATNTKSKTTANMIGSGDKALKLSPTEQNIRNSLRRSSRRKSSTTTGGSSS